MRPFLFMLAVALLPWGASAQVKVVKSAGQKTAMDWSAYQAGGDVAAQTFLRVLTDDLMRSGWFLRGAPGQAELALTGSAAQQGGALRAEVRVYGRVAQREYLGKVYSQDAGQARQLAHRVADEVVFAITGRKGIASGRLAMVGNQTGHKEIYLVDADGFNPRAITRDANINVGPNWSRDGRRLVYTSFRSGFPDLYIHDVRAPSRQVVSRYSGLNTGGAFSPDGQFLAMVLSKDANPELYIKNLSGSGLTRLTQTKGAEASPTWSPDGSQIAYVSDDSGYPQIYVKSRSGGAPRRLTVRGSQNVAPDWGANNLIAYASLLGGRWSIWVMDPATGEGKQVSPGDADYEDPTWAPDGRHLAASRSVRYQSRVYLLDSMGDPPIALTDSTGDWYSPAWAPDP